MSVNSKIFLFLLTLAWVTRYNDTGYMASGHWTFIGAVACPREIKLGTWVRIDGREYVCHDRTNKRLNGRYDIYDSREDKELFAWGKRKLNVEIIN